MNFYSSKRACQEWNLSNPSFPNFAKLCSACS